MSLDGLLPCGCTEERHALGPCQVVIGSHIAAMRAAHGLPDPYRSAAPPPDPDRVDARRLIDTDPTARAFHDSVAHFYLRGTLSVAELRVLFTMGLEHGMALETRRGRKW